MMSDSWFDIQNAPVNDLKKRNLKLSASRRIRNDQGLTIFSIEGLQQTGKTAYSMRILMDLFGNDKDSVLGHMSMNATSFKDMVEAALRGKYREKCIVWDDLSVGGSASKWMVDPMLVMKLAGLGDTLGIATKAFIMTSPSGDMIKAFRNYNKYKVIINPGRHYYERKACGYRIGKSPMNQRWCSLEFEDYYDVRIPFYEEYSVMRHELSIKAVQEFGEKEQEDISRKAINSLCDPYWVREQIDSGEKRYGDVREAIKTLFGKHVTEDAVRMMLKRIPNNARTPVI